MTFSSHILITGSSGGLGREVAYAFARQDALIGLHYSKNEENVRKLSMQLSEKGSESYLVRYDFSKSSNINNFVDKIKSQKHKINVLVLNAGTVTENLILKTSENDWDKTLHINYKANVEIIDKLSDNLLAEGCHVIIIGSHTGLKGSKGLTVYSASKGALTGYAIDAAKRYAKKNILINVILPGWLKTEMTSHIKEDDYKKNISENILGRPNNTKEVAEFILSLTLMKNVSGQIFRLDSRPVSE